MVLVPESVDADLRRSKRIWSCAAVGCCTARRQFPPLESGAQFSRQECAQVQIGEDLTHHWVLLAHSRRGDMMTTFSAGPRRRIGASWGPQVSKLWRAQLLVQAQRKRCASCVILHAGQGAHETQSFVHRWNMCHSWVNRWHAPICLIPSCTTSFWRCRRVVGDILRRIVGRTIAQQISAAVESATAPLQCAMSTWSGIVEARPSCNSGIN